MSNVTPIRENDPDDTREWEPYRDVLGEVALLTVGVVESARTPSGAVRMRAVGFPALGEVVVDNIGLASRGGIELTARAERVIEWAAEGTNGASWGDGLDLSLPFVVATEATGAVASPEWSRSLDSIFPNIKRARERRGSDPLGEAMRRHPAGSARIAGLRPGSPLAEAVLNLIRVVEETANGERDA